MVKRVIVTAVSLAAALLLVGSLVLWAILSSWVPVKGKALLIQELERQQPVSVSIGSIRYRLVQGFVLADVRIVDRANRQLWAEISTMQVRPGWLTLLVNRNLAFRGRALLEAPCQTVISVSGWYHLGTKALTLNAQTTELSIRSVAEPLRRLIPAPLEDGTMRLQLHLKQLPQSLPAITGRLIGTGLVWNAPPWRASGDLTVNGTMAPPAAQHGRWSIQALATLRDGVLDGVPGVGSIDQLDGDAHITQDRIEIHELTGTLLGSLWKLEGTVTQQPLAVEVLVTSRVRLAPIAAAVQAIAPLWQPDGTADLRAVCRGPLRSSPAIARTGTGPTPLLDCLAHAELRDVMLNGVKLTDPLTDLAGNLAYDLLTRRLSIGRLDGRIGGEPFSASGDVRLTDPVELALHVEATLPLHMITPWLPAGAAMSELDGTTAINLQITGSTTAPHLTGSVEVTDVAARIAKPALTIEHLSGSAKLAEELIEIPEATMRLNNQPLTLNATITPGSIPGIKTAVRFPQGQLWLVSRVSPQEVIVDKGRLTLQHSQVDVHGSLARAPSQPSALTLSGAIDLAELDRLPFVSLPKLSEWKPQGIAEVQGQFQGRWSDWPSAAIQGRLRADHLSVRDIPLDQLDCAFEQNDRVLRVRIPSGQLAQGQLAGELTVEHGEATRDYLLQADVTGLQLANLTQVVPAWKSRSVTGQASAHTVLAGTWEQRGSWRGEGWLTGSGEQLGDVPLLDKVFRGLFGILADRLGLDMLRRAQITQVSLRWRLAQGRFATDDLRLGGLAGTEPIAIYAKGNIGFDQTLDFVIEPELSEGVVLQAPMTSTLAGTILKAAGQLERLRRLIGRHRLTGTLKDPVYRFEFSSQEVLKQLAPAPADLLQNLLDAVR